AYEEGLRNDFWIPLKAYWKDRSERNAVPLRQFLTYESTKWQYTNGVRNVENISPDAWTTDQYLLDRPGADEIQLQLFYDYGSNPPLSPQRQAHFQSYRPPHPIVLGQNDPSFSEERAAPNKHDCEQVDFHLLHSADVMHAE